MKQVRELNKTIEKHVSMLEKSSNVLPSTMQETHFNVLEQVVQAISMA